MYVCTYYVHAHTCTHTHILTYIPCTEELDRPTTGSGLDHNKENIQRSTIQIIIKINGPINAYIYIKQVMLLTCAIVRKVS